MAMGAVANGGKLMQPYLVKELRNSQGVVVKQFSPQVVRQVLSSDTAQEERSLLQRVIDAGTGTTARLDGYSAGGKTGTGQKALPGGGYSDTAHVLDFLGFAPVDQPRLVCLVLLDSPQGIQFGSVQAAPAFKDVMNASLRYLQVPMSYLPSGTTLNDDLTVVPPVINLTLPEAQQALAAAGLAGETSGQGQVVLDQVPVNGVKLKKGSRVLLSLDASGVVPAGDRTVPDLKGESLRDAAEELADINLILVPEGGPFATGTAVSQDTLPGTKVSPGSKVTVKFESLLPLASGP
jgi:stage V sporulation protein D (sporulation-specific penicillin-binding protein)